MSTTDRYRAAGLRAPKDVGPADPLPRPDYPFQDTAPSGGPDESWTVESLRAYAQARSIDLSGASRKADVLAAITAHPDANTTEEQS